MGVEMLGWLATMVFAYGSASQGAKEITLSELARPKAKETALWRLNTMEEWAGACSNPRGDTRYAQAVSILFDPVARKCKLGLRVWEAPKQGWDSSQNFPPKRSEDFRAQAEFNCSEFPSGDKAGLNKENIAWSEFMKDTTLAEDFTREMAAFRPPVLGLRSIADTGKETGK